MLHVEVSEGLVCPPRTLVQSPRCDRQWGWAGGHCQLMTLRRKQLPGHQKHLPGEEDPVLRPHLSPSQVMVLPTAHRFTDFLRRSEARGGFAPGRPVPRVPTSFRRVPGPRRGDGLCSHPMASALSLEWHHSPHTHLSSPQRRAKSKALEFKLEMLSHCCFLQAEELRLRDRQGLAQCHTANWCQSKASDSIRRSPTL